MDWIVTIEKKDRHPTETSHKHLEVHVTGHKFSPNI